MKHQLCATISSSSGPANNACQKFIKDREILKILRAGSNNLELPNYLKISRFETTDSGYYVQVQNLSALPFGGGGTLRLYYLKSGDSLTNVKRSATSIN